MTTGRTMLRTVTGHDAERRWYTLTARTPTDAAPTATADLTLYDVIGGGDRTVTDLVAVISELDAEEITVGLRSPGGDAWDGVTIYNALRDHPATIVTRNDALAASAASIIFMAGDRRVMNRSSQLMIHNASALTYGDAVEMRRAAEMLENVNVAMADIYAGRTGTTPDVWLDAMAAESWYLPERAVEARLATEAVANDDSPSGHGEGDSGADAGGGNRAAVASLDEAAILDIWAATRRHSSAGDAEPGPVFPLTTTPAPFAGLWDAAAAADRPNPFASLLSTPGT